MKRNARTLIVGLGSDFGDDRLGAVVVKRIGPTAATCEVRFLRTPLGLLDILEGVEQLHVVDACRGAGLPGTIVRRDWPLTDAESVRFGGTHDVDLLSVLNLAERFKTIPTRVTIWGVEATNGTIASDFHKPLSRLVDEAVDQVAKRIVAEVNDEPVSAMEANRHA
jgi:hydrogenase maturation protease